MGLDIYVFRPYKPEDPTAPELQKAYHYSSDEEVLQHFPNLVVNRDVVTNMWGDFWKSRGLDPDDWGVDGWWDGCHQFRHKTSGKNLSVPGDDVPKAIIKTSVVYYEEVGYQRKNMESDFYDNLYDEGTDESRRYCFERDQFVVDVSFTLNKKHTKENLLKPFRKGKCFAYYSW